MFKIRPFHFKDIFCVKEMLAKQWDLGKTASKSDGSICAWVYAFGLVASSKKLFILEEKGKTKGISGYRFFDQPCDSFINRLSHHLWHLSFNSPSVTDQDALEAYHRVGNDLFSHIHYEDLKGSALLTVLLVDPDLRGQGAGQLLFDKVKAECKQQKHYAIYIGTDDTCSYHFYDKQGAGLTYQMPITHHYCEPNATKALLYCYRIQREIE